MAIELRPLNLGEILDRIFQLYRARFVTFTGIAAFGSAILLLWELGEVLALRLLLRHHLLRSTVTAVGGLGNILSWVVFVLVLAVMLAAMNRAVVALCSGEDITIAGSLSAVRPHWFRYVLLNATTVLLAGAPIALAATMIFLPIALAARVRSLLGGNILTILYAVAGLAMMCALPLSAWLMVRYSLANSASMSEDLGIGKALHRSTQLSKGLRGKIFVLLLLAGAAQSLVAGLLVLPVIPSARRAANHMSFGINAYGFGAGFLSHVLTIPIYGIGLALFYLDARIRKEGFDIEWMLERSMAAGKVEEESSEPARTEPDLV